MAKKPKMQESDILEAAISACTRDESNAISEAELKQELIKRLPPIDIDALNAERARKIIDSCAKESTSSSQLVLSFPGLDPYPYDANRLIRGSNGGIVENRLASPEYKVADAARSRDNMNAVVKSYSRKANEAEAHVAWAMQEMEKGRPATELSFGVFIKETDVLHSPLLDAAE